MKKIILLLSILWFSNTKAQITLEHTFPGNTTEFYNRLIYLDIGNNDFKYVLVNYVTSTFDIYNSDYSPFQLNIETALPLEQYDIAYISKTLFDCDDTNIEYGLMNDSSVKIYRQDGTLLFSRENVLAPYCFGCNNGSNLLVPIINTPSGTKLILQDNANHATYVYSLCGTLPLVNIDFERNSLVTVFPVPTESGKINFKVNIPNNLINSQIELFDVNMQKLDEIEINETNTIVSKNHNFAPGVYFYTFKNSGKIIKTGKFIVK